MTASCGWTNPVRLTPGWSPISVVRLAALPLTINGKLDVDALPRPSLVAAVPPHASGNEVPVGAATGAGTVRQVWEQVLGVTGIRDRDNFFDVGGTSLNIVEVHARLVRAFDVPDLAMVDLFEYSSPAAMADRIEACRRHRFPETHRQALTAAAANGGRDGA
jgi:epothilone synthetase B